MEETFPLHIRGRRRLSRRVSVRQTLVDSQGSVQVEFETMGWLICETVVGFGIDGCRYLHLGNDNPVFGVGLISFCKSIYQPSGSVVRERTD